MLIAQQLTVNAGKNMAKPAFRYLGKETNYKDLCAAISRLSYLYQHEIGQGNRVAFYARNSPAYIATFFAMTNTRSVTIPLDPDRPPDELIAWIKDSKATHLAVTSDLLPRARELVQAGHLSVPIIEIEKKHGGEYDTSFTPPPENRPVETDVVLLLRTAGTTGKPRYVQFTHKQLAHAAMAMKSHYHLLGTDRFLTTMSWFHPFPFTHHMLFPLMSGACVVIDHGLQAVEFLDFLVDSRVTRLIGTPPFYLRLLVTCKNEKRMLPGIKSITVGLGLLEAPLMRAFTLLKVAVSHCYGQAENLWTLAMQDTAEPGGMSAEGAYEKGFVGKGMIGLKYKVVDDQGDEVEGKEDRMGQLCATSPMIMTGYMDLEKEQKQKIRGTWLYTGDIAKLTGDGDELRITYIGRKDDILMVEGKPIIMSQIDQVLRACPSLSDAAAFSIKNSKGKPVIVCAAVKKAGAQVNEKQVVDFASTHLAAEMMPIAVAFTDTIPRDLGNNVNCSKLRGQFSGIGG